MASSLEMVSDSSGRTAFPRSPTQSLSLTRLCYRSNKMANSPRSIAHSASPLGGFALGQLLDGVRIVAQGAQDLLVVLAQQRWAEVVGGRRR